MRPIVYIANVLKCSRRIVAAGIRELKKMPMDVAYQKRIRKFGGGRWYYRRAWANINNIFSDVLKNYTTLRKVRLQHQPYQFACTITKHFFSKKQLRF